MCVMKKASMNYSFFKGVWRISRQVSQGFAWVGFAWWVSRCSTHPTLTYMGGDFIIIFYQLGNTKIPSTSTGTPFGKEATPTKARAG